MWLLGDRCVPDCPRGRYGWHGACLGKTFYPGHRGAGCCLPSLMVRWTLIYIQTQRPLINMRIINVPSSPLASNVKRTQVKGTGRPSFSRNHRSVLPAPSHVLLTGSFNLTLFPDKVHTELLYTAVVIISCTWGNKVVVCPHFPFMGMNKCFTEPPSTFLLLQTRNRRPRTSSRTLHGGPGTSWTRFSPANIHLSYSTGCHPSCDACSGAGPLSCTSCPADAVLLPSGLCAPNCPLGYYDDGRRVCQRKRNTRIPQMWRAL